MKTSRRELSIDMAIDGGIFISNQNHAFPHLPYKYDLFKTHPLEASEVSVFD